MVRWTPKSEEDLDLIREHIAPNFGVDLAIETVRNIVQQTETVLSRNPLAGAVVESNPLFSKLVVDGNAVFYCENPKDRHLYIVYVQPRHTSHKLQRLKANF